MPFARLGTHWVLHTSIDVANPAVGGMVEYFNDEAAKVRWYREHGLMEFWIGEDQRLLRKRGIDLEDEGALLKVLRAAPRGALRHEALRCLIEGGVATKRSLPVLKKLALDPEQGTAGPATRAVGLVAGRASLGFFRGLLRRPGRPFKFMLFDELAQWGGESDLASAFDLLRGMYSKTPTRGFMGWQAASAELLEFLCGFPGHVQTRKALEWTLVNWKKFKIDHDSLPYRVPEAGPPSERPAVCLLGRPSLSYVRLYNAMQPKPDFVVKPKRLEYAVIPVDVGLPNAARQASRAARLCHGIIVMDRVLLKHSVVQKAGLAKGRPVLALKPPRPLEDWGNWHLGRDSSSARAVALEAANIRAVRAFVRKLARG